MALSGLLALPRGRVPAWVVKLQWKPQPLGVPDTRTWPRTARSLPSMESAVGPSDWEGASAPCSWERAPGAQRQRRRAAPAQTMAAPWSCGEESSAVLAAVCRDGHPLQRARDAHSGSSHDAAMPVCALNPPPCGLITPLETAQLCALRGAEGGGFLLGQRVPRQGLVPSPMPPWNKETVPAALPHRRGRDGRPGQPLPSCLGAQQSV